MDFFCRNTADKNSQDSLIGDEREKVIKDQLIFSPAKIPHRLLNESNKSFRFLVIKTPTPTTQTQIL